ncbi:HAD-IA family hydrolase [bacterium]|nr:HAD-IA family hydrolase [bacterium]
MKNYKAVLFDLDGTLLDTAPDLVHATNTVLAAQGLPAAALADVRGYVSRGARGMVAQTFGALDDATASTHADALVAAYRERLVVDSVLFDGMDRVIAALDASAMPWGVVSNKMESLVRPILDHFPWAATCGCRIGGDTLSTRKPDPAPLLLGAKQLDVEPGDCLYVGDAHNDVIAAHAAGMACVAASYGYLPPGENAAQWNADYVIDHAEQLLPIVGLEDRA